MASTSTVEVAAVIQEALSGDLEHLPPFWRDQVTKALESTFWEGYAFGLTDGENAFWD